MRVIKIFAACAMLAMSATLLAGCQGSSLGDIAPKAERELPTKIVQKMKAKGMAKNSPVYFRLFKDEHLVEVWKQKTTGRYEMIANYNICAWSGTLGPKIKEGDRQAPEGYYPIKSAQLNPASKYFLAINTGFPNAYDRAHGRTGGDLMIHGACSSSGCYSMTDQNIQEIFAFGRDAFEGGQQEFILEALPFRMTAEKMALYSKHKDFAFWQMLKEGYDYFELTKTPPKVGFCEKKYVFNRTSPDGTPLSVNGACPPVPQSAFAATYASYQSKYENSYAAAAKKFENTPFPIVMGGKSRPLDKKWDPQPVKPAKTAELPKPVKAMKGSAEEDATIAELQAIVDAGAKAAKADAPATVAAKPADAIAPAKLEGQQAAVAPSSEAAVPLPDVNPNTPAETEPAKKKKRWWPFNGS